MPLSVVIIICFSTVNGCPFWGPSRPQKAGRNWRARLLYLLGWILFEPLLDDQSNTGCFKITFAPSKSLKVLRALLKGPQIIRFQDIVFQKLYFNYLFLIS